MVFMNDFNAFDVHNGHDSIDDPCDIPIVYYGLNDCVVRYA
jgi:hypothetical protein